MPHKLNFIATIDCIFTGKHCVGVRCAINKGKIITAKTRIVIRHTKSKYRHFYTVKIKKLTTLYVLALFFNFICWNYERVLSLHFFLFVILYEKIKTSVYFVIFNRLYIYIPCEMAATVSIYRWNNDPSRGINIQLKTNQPRNRIMAVLDCMKDAFKVKDNKVENKKIFVDFLTKEFPPPNQNELDVRTILTSQKLGKLFRTIMSENSNFITEEVFERADGTSHRINMKSCLNESGWAGEKLSVHDNKIISFDVAANHTDCGPGNGNVCFPPIGWVMEFDHNVMKQLGFNQIISFKVTTIGIHHYYYEVIIQYKDKAPLALNFSNKYCSNPMKISNPTKNISINGGDYGRHQFELLYILHKAGGDPRQMETGSVFYQFLIGDALGASVYDFLKDHDTSDAFLQHIVGKIVSSTLKNDNSLNGNTVAIDISGEIRNDIINMNRRINEHSREFFSLPGNVPVNQTNQINRLFASTFMSCTGDNTAFYKSIELGCPAVLSPGGKNSEGNKEGLCYQPTTDPMIALRNTVEVAFKQIKDNHDNLKEILDKLQQPGSKVVAKINGPRRIMIKTLYEFRRDVIASALAKLNELEIKMQQIKDGITTFIGNAYFQDPAQSNLMYKCLSTFVYVLKKNFIFPVIFTPQIRSGGRTIDGYFIDVDAITINSVRDNTLLLNDEQLLPVARLLGYVANQDVPPLPAEYHSLLVLMGGNNLDDIFKNDVLVILDPIFREGNVQITDQLNRTRGQRGGKPFKQPKINGTKKTPNLKGSRAPTRRGVRKIVKDDFGLSSTRHLDEYFVYKHKDDDYVVIDKIKKLKRFYIQNQILKRKILQNYETSEINDSYQLLGNTETNENIEISLGKFLSEIGKDDSGSSSTEKDDSGLSSTEIEILQIATDFVSEKDVYILDDDNELRKDLNLTNDLINSVYFSLVYDLRDMVMKRNFNRIVGKISVFNGGYSKKKTYKSKNYRKPKRNETKNRKKKSKSKRKTKK